MILQLKLKYGKPVLPVSTNKSHYKSGRLTQEARDYRTATFDQLRAYKAELAAFKQYADNTMDNNKTCLKLNIRHYMDNGRYFTKAGKMSKTAGDADNYTKLLQDFLFNERYTEATHAITNIAINDAFIKNCNATIIPHNSREWLIHITVEVINIADL